MSGDVVCRLGPSRQGEAVPSDPQLRGMNWGDGKGGEGQHRACTPLLLSLDRPGPLPTEANCPLPSLVCALGRLGRAKPSGPGGAGLWGASVEGRGRTLPQAARSRSAQKPPPAKPLSIRGDHRWLQTPFPHSADTQRYTVHDPINRRDGCLSTCPQEAADPSLCNTPPGAPRAHTRGSSLYNLQTLMWQPCGGLEGSGVPGEAHCEGGAHLLPQNWGCREGWQLLPTTCSPECESGFLQTDTLKPSGYMASRKPGLPPMRLQGGVLRPQ